VSAGRSARALLAAAILSAPASTVAATLELLNVTGWTSLDGGMTQVPFDLEEVTNPDGSRSVSGDGVSSAATVEEITHYAAGGLFASAAPGVLKVEVDALAFIDALPFYHPRVIASAGARLTDNLLVTSSTLPNGTPVDYTVTLRVLIGHDVPVWYKPSGGPAPGTFTLNLYYGASGGTNLFLPVDFGGPSVSWPVANPISYTQPYPGTAAVGDSIPLYLNVAAGAQQWVTVGDSIYHQSHIDASNSIEVFVDAETPGVELVAESGHDYSIAAPEPSAFALAVVAVATLAARRIS
jgi:hypothetical protein